MNERIPAGVRSGEVLMCRRGGVEPHGIDTRTRAPGVVRDGTETPSNGGKHG